MASRLARIDSWENLAQQAKFKPSVMAGHCHVSVRQPQRFFERQYGTSPGEWSRDLRIQRARQLISRGWSSIKPSHASSASQTARTCAASSTKHLTQPHRPTPLGVNGCACRDYPTMSRFYNRWRLELPTRMVNVIETPIYRREPLRGRRARWRRQIRTEKWKKVNDKCQRLRCDPIACIGSCLPSPNPHSFCTTAITNGVQSTTLSSCERRRCSLHYF